MKVNSRRWKSFVTCLIIPIDSKKTKTVFKRYISSRIELLRTIDTQHSDNSKQYKMFDKNGKFKEIKGSSLTYELKKDFIEYFSQKKLFDIYYIHYDNSNIQPTFYSNTARAFNFPIKLLLDNYITKNYSATSYVLNIDERNQKTNTQYFLQEYLNTEIGLTKNIDFRVQYFDSEQNSLIQIADVFSNFYYSNTIDDKFNNELQELKDKDILQMVFYYPKK